MSGKNIQYSPLLQSIPSEDEDESVEFSTDGRHDRELRPELHHDIPMHELGSHAPRHHGNGAVTTHSKRRRRMNLIAVVVVGCVVVVAGFLGAAFVIVGQEVNAGRVLPVEEAVPYGDWTLFFNATATESYVTLQDVDGDGLEDVLVGLVGMEHFMRLSALLGTHTMRQACAEIGFAYPCCGQAVALRGYDRKELWRTWVAGNHIFSNCDNIDVNSDKKPDCILTGRKSTVQAVDLATGHTHWLVDANDPAWSGHFVPAWNVFRALSIPDMDGDGVDDLVITHGGNQSKEAEDHKRAPGRVMCLSGATGKPHGRYLELPGSKETYMSPVRHTTANGSTYFLFGSGGETIPGDLLMISSLEFRQYIIGQGQGPAPLHVLFRCGGQEKGVMVAPVMADVTSDGTADILVSAFEGVLVMYDGETLQELWTHHFPGMESYSTPAPGHYDQDGILDFLVQWGHGAWQSYDYAEGYMISGRDGSILWRSRSRTMEMFSDLSLRTTGSRDLFIYHVQTGEAATPVQSATAGGHGVISASGKRKRRHIGGHEGLEDTDPARLDESAESFHHRCEDMHEDYEKSHPLCHSSGVVKQQVRLLEERQAASPPVVSNLTSQQFTYSLPLADNGRHCHQLSPSNSKLVEMCVVMTPKPLTGAVGDVDGDGTPDLIQLDTLMALTLDDQYGYQGEKVDVVLSRTSLGPALTGHAGLLPIAQQPWRQFMGSAGDNVYRTQ